MGYSIGSLRFYFTENRYIINNEITKGSVIDMKKWLLSIASVALSLSMGISTFGVTGTIVNGKTMVPVRGVFEQLGFQVIGTVAQVQLT